MNVPWVPEPKKIKKNKREEKERPPFLLSFSFFFLFF